MKRRNFLIVLSGLFGSMVPLELKSKENEQIVPVLPPGAGSRKSFNSFCTSCHLCISRCPSKILTPSKNELDVKNVGQPFIDYEKGYCRYDCVECIKVCPTGALTIAGTLIDKQRTQIGIAIYKSHLCHINSKKISCQMCYQNCPTGAITMKNGANNLLIPSINISKCIGCGACQYYCPTSANNKAIYVNGTEIQKKLIL
ncbi:MAG: 4Fe-4S dicluster domain-containing protein [Bacteroidetes bacterium]|nr:4Fe-4S dicluster domain-containing protein [Bacteroidota bacterium]